MSDPQAFGYVSPTFPDPMGPHDAKIIIYGYIPSLTLGILAIVLFGIGFAIHTWQLVRYRAWWFSPVLVGTAMEVVGYIFRILSSQQDPYSIPWFVVQYFFIVVAPVLFSAGIYTTLSGMINAFGREYSPLSPKAILWIFISCDVVATVVQIAGAASVGQAYSNRKNPDPANNALLAGLAFQVASFTLFLVLFAWMSFKARHLLASINRSMFISFVLATMAVYLRTCFRLSETAEGPMSRLSTHEVYFGCLEFAPMVVAVAALAYGHPGRWLASAEKRTSEKATDGERSAAEIDALSRV